MGQVEQIHNRYQIIEQLGEGGMGVVYRARDRLTQSTVALKRVSINAQNLVFNSQSNQEDTLRALAQEFKLLASLRHPNIISVLDYGFDDEQQPFFTMELLADSQNIVEASQTATINQKLDFIMQMLQALAYLHRHDILHRDLKPDNVQVVDGRVKVLDFGLAIRAKSVQEESIVGTLAYMPPETLDERPATPASDLYALGIIAYEIIAGEYPFVATDVVRLIEQILTKQPDIEALDVDLAISQIIERLTLKAPEDRYATAQAVIERLRAATGKPQADNLLDIRESYLQTASFVGREVELNLLDDALMLCQKGLGSIYLIAGESGVGKSRLIEELRVNALVQGFDVLVGQGIAEGGASFILWRDAISKMLLTTPVTDDDAAVLKEVTPNIDALLERTITAAPSMSDQNSSERLQTVVLNLFKRQTEPTLVLLEDLHWTYESLDLLKQLQPIIDKLPILIVGTYRDDEGRDIAAEIPQARVITLERFAPHQIKALSQAVLGSAGTQPQVVDLLARETEGNAFFIVEVIRALADDAGALEHVGELTLPPRIFAAGMQSVIQNRLERVPEWAKQPLRLAAVAGRYLDTDLLQTALPTIDWTTWLTLCENLALLNVQDNQWRFAHDKIRTTLHEHIADNERQDLHRTVATALEQQYADSLDDYAVVLAHHWHEANDPAKELEYSNQAGKQSIHVGAYQQAMTFLRRAIEIGTATNLDPSELGVLHELLGRAYYGLSQFEPAKVVFQQGFDIYQTVNHLAGMAKLRARIANVQNDLGEADDAKASHTQSLAWARESADEAVIAYALNQLGRFDMRQGNFEASQQAFDEALTHYQNLKDDEGIASVEANLGGIAFYVGEFETAKINLESSLNFYREMNIRERIVAGLNNLGAVYWVLGDYNKSEAYLREVLPMCREMDDKVGVAAALNNLGDIAYRTENYADAKTMLDESILIFESISHHWGTVGALIIRGNVQRKQADYSPAATDLMRATQLAQEIEATPQVLSALISLAQLKHAQELDAAWVKQVVQVVKQHPSSDSDTREQATSLAEKIGVNPDENLDIEALLAKILGELESAHPHG